MTNHFYGPSLFQARKTDNNHKDSNVNHPRHHPRHRYSHSHLHGRSVSHLRSHAQFHRRQEENETADLDSSDPTITEVVQTISVVQVIDGSGAIIETKTLSSDPQTNLLDAKTGSTIDTNFKAVSPTSGSAPPVTTSSTAAETPVSSVGTASDASLTATSLPPPGTTDLTTSIVPTISLPPSLSSSPAFPSLSSTLNSTTSSFTSSTSALLSSSSTRSNATTTQTSSGSSSASQSLSSLVTTLSSSFSAASVSGTTSSPLSGFTSSSNSPTTSSTGASSSSSSSSSSGSLSTSASPSTTLDIWGGGGSAGTTPLPTPSSSSTSDPSSDDGTPPTGTVVGGVVGGVAGLALLVAFAFVLLRFRKRGWCQLRLGDEKSITPATRVVDAGPSGDSGAGSGAQRTSQRSSVPYSVASSLAALAGKRSSRERSNTGSEMAERGFVRVSGKKLPPVLQYGGDGYSDPRDRSSLNSDATVYRDSMAIFNQSSSPQRLALGSPMRPESGVMVYNPGPAKTPVTGEVPKTIDAPTMPQNSTLPTPDVIGRTLAAQDHSRDGAASRTSRGSARFTEQLS